MSFYIRWYCNSKTRAGYKPVRVDLNWKFISRAALFWINAAAVAKNDAGEIPEDGVNPFLKKKYS